MEVKAEYLEVFCEEASEQVAEWERSLLTLERSSNDGEALNDMFRAIHTLKGSAGFVGFEELQRLAHDLESSLAGVREGERPFDAHLSEMLFEGLDRARAVIDSFAEGRPAPAPHEGHARGPRIGAASQPEQPTRAPASSGSLLARMTRLRTGAPITTTLIVRIEGANREAYLRSCIVKARLERLGTILKVDPPPELLRDGEAPFVYAITIQAAADGAKLLSALVIDQVEVALAAAAGASAAAEASSAVEAQSAAGPAAGAERSPTAAGEAGAAESPALAAAPGRAPLRTSRPEEVVRVSVRKLDSLLNLVGELVINSSGFAVVAQRLKEQLGKAHLVVDLEERGEALARITRDLQEGIMKARMLPIAEVFNRFHRVVRDLAKASGKSVALELSGEETEIDKKVIDRIGEPLVHLVRNAVDHGLEPPAARVAAGKPEQGRVRLAAYQEGDHICIEVSDDGRGLDREAILRKAVERGLIGGDEALRATPEEILAFIFLPGFTTARVISDISGRGIGMDAVKSAVEELNGAIRVRSTAGSGTTVILSLPLTMAIITAVLVEAAGSTYAIPIGSVREIVKAGESERRTVGTHPVILLRNEVLALASLAESLKGWPPVSRPPASKERPAGAQGSGTLTPEPAAARSAFARRPVVVVAYEGLRIGIEVDRVIGSREVVVKSLSRNYREVDGLIGASILGDGRLALIVDVQALTRQHQAAAGRAQPVAQARPGAAVASRVARLPAAADSPRAPSSAREGALAPAPFAGTPAVQPPAPEEASIEQLAREVGGAKGRLFDEVNNQGALRASIALSQLTGREISVGFPESRLIALKAVAEELGGEERSVCGIYLGVSGELSGGMLLVIPADELPLLDDLLHGREPGTARDLDSVDLSGVGELGNILASCFINSIADAARLALGPETPELTIDMCQSVVDSVLARFNLPGDRLLLTKTTIFGHEQNAVCHQLLFLEPSSLRMLMGALSTNAAAAVA